MPAFLFENIRWQGVSNNL